MIESWSTILLSYWCYFYSSKGSAQSLAAVCLVSGALTDSNPQGLHKVWEQTSSQSKAQFWYPYFPFWLWAIISPSPAAYFLYILPCMFILKVYLEHLQQIKCQRCANWITLITSENHWKCKIKLFLTHLVIKANSWMSVCKKWFHHLVILYTYASTFFSPFNLNMCCQKSVKTNIKSTL